MTDIEYDVTTKQTFHIDLNDPRTRERLTQQGLFRGGFLPMTPDPPCYVYNPNIPELSHEIRWFDCIISGFPAGTTMVSAWASENAGGVSHAGEASVFTWGVQMFENGTKCRVRFGIRYSAATLPAGVLLMYA
jgi:hypothetical protein